MRKAKQKTLADRAVGAAMTRTDGGRWRKQYTRRRKPSNSGADATLEAERQLVLNTQRGRVHQEPTQTQDESGSREALQSSAHAAVDRFHGLIAVVDQQVAQHKLSSILTVLRAKVQSLNDELASVDGGSVPREEIVRHLSRAIAMALAIEPAGPAEATTEG